MYVPNHFAEPDHALLHRLMQEAPLATLVAATAQGLEANHIPLLFQSSPEPYGCLQGHIARANALWRNLAPGQEVLAIFHGPEGYISPSWYPGKVEHGREVPTWNYFVAHVHGVVKVIEDAAWVHQQVSALTRQQEAAMPAPWQVSDAPQDYIDQMVKAIVGIEITITRLVGKAKLSQNKPQGYRVAVSQALATQPEGMALSALVAAKLPTQGS